MTDISELVGGSAHAAPRPSNARGRVVKAPATTADPMTVTLENYSSLYEYEVPAFHWQPHTDTLPIVGTVCVVMFDDDGDAWVPEWEGAAAPPAVDPMHLIGAVGEPAFTNSWVNFDVARAACFYRQDGRVYLQGMIRSGTVGLAAFTLPAGYRHGATGQLNYAVTANGAFGELGITPGGAVIPGVGSNAYVDLSSISFRTAL